VDAVRLGDKAKQRSVAIERPRATLFDDLKVRLVVPVEQLAGDLAVWAFVHELQSVRAVPLHVDDRHEAIGQDAPHDAVG